MRTVLTTPKAVGMMRKAARYHGATYAHMRGCAGLGGLLLWDGSKLYRFRDNGVVRYMHVTYP